MTDSTHSFMQAAIALSFDSIRHHQGGPYGSVVVKDGIIIGQGMNLVTVTHDPTAHAEMLAIRAACQTLQSFQLSGCELYTSCEPCPMCMAAIYWAKLDRVYYANSKEDAAQFGFNSQLLYDELSRPIAQRQMPMQQLLQPEAEGALQEWANQANKVRY